MSGGSRQRLLSALPRLVVAAPATLALLLVLVAGMPAPPAAIALCAVVIALTVLLALSRQRPRERVLQSVARMIEALREGDYGARGAPPVDAAEDAELVRGINLLAEHLQRDRVALHENLQLLDKTLAALDSAVFMFDADNRLRLTNPAGKRLLSDAAMPCIGRSDADLGLDHLFDEPQGSVQGRAFPGHRGRWQVSHATLRTGGRTGRLLVLQPIEQALRREEGHAFGRLLRVLGHEINNSMAPIISVADTLAGIVADGDGAAHEDLREGLRLISRRGAALQRFIDGYAKLAQLPAPKPTSVSLASVAGHVRNLFAQHAIAIESDDDATVLADRDQLEQALINLIRNAIEAGGGSGVVALRWHAQGTRVRIEIVDDGHGLPTSDSLFVPFFTTKRDGSGIGLVLSRQIVEAQDGTLELHNRQDAAGAVAVIELPRAAAPAAVR